MGGRLFYDGPVSGTEVKQSTEKSEARFKAACRVMPGGAGSPVRAFQEVGGPPRFIARGSGAVLTDVDGHEYLDYVCGWGPLILGHADERVEAAVGKAAAKGCTFGAPTEIETQLAELVISRMPAIEMIRFVNSGVEAMLSAIRLARAFTRRDKIVVCEGCYHGCVDALLAEVGPGTAGPGVPSSPGVPRGAVADTLVVPYNDAEAATGIMGTHGSEVAAVLIEPMASSMGLIPPVEGYLETVRDLCDRVGALLIFDEITTGFRVSPGGAQARFGVNPDLTCLGTLVGGGLPVGAFGGARKVMELISPAGPVHPAGALSGNPLAMAAGVAALQALAEPGVYETLEKRSALLAEGLAAASSEAGVPVYQTRVGSMGGLFFTSQPVIDFATTSRCNAERYAQFFQAMLDRGVYLPPSPSECYFVSTAHEPEQIARTIEAAEEAFEVVAAENPER